MKMLCVTNQKGGVGKSTLAWHIGKYAEKMGLRVLLIDLDEGDLTDMSGVTPQNGYISASSLFLEDSVAPGRFLKSSDAISVIFSDLGIVDVEMMDMDAAVKRLNDKVSVYKNDFDLCVVDVPPNASRRTIAALGAADATFIPMDVSYLSIKRLPRVFASIDVTKKRYNPRLKMLGVLLNKVNGVSKKEKEAAVELRESLGDMLMTSMIFLRTCIGIAVSESRPVWEKARSGSQRTAAAEVKAACKEVLEKMGIGEKNELK